MPCRQFTPQLGLGLLQRAGRRSTPSSSRLDKERAFWQMDLLPQSCQSLRAFRHFPLSKRTGAFFLLAAPNGTGFLPFHHRRTRLAPGRMTLPATVLLDCDAQPHTHHLLCPSGIDLFMPRGLSVVRVWSSRGPLLPSYAAVLQ